ncbi:MAG: Nif3-like dinuclear metal center hexameric protein [Thermoplasmataceae archaeon]
MRNKSRTPAAPSNARTPKLSHVVTQLEKIAPSDYAEPWDHVGLLAAPGFDAPVRRVLIALDLTLQVYEQCQEQKIDLLICYHPPIFDPIRTLVPRDRTPPALAMELFRRGAAIYSPHTALDVVEGGTNDALASALGIHVERSMQPGREIDPQFKLITFMPSEAVEKLAAAVFEAGAGHIGKNSRYTCCGFHTPGHGTFRGDETTHPAVGKKGRLESVPEIRWETVVHQTALSQAIAALKAAHPYEEPAFDVIPMANPPTHPGMGRIGTLPQAMQLGELAKLAKKSLRLPMVQITTPSTVQVRTCAIIAGSGGQLALEAWRKQPFDVLITGELKHHDLLAYRAAGVNVLLLGHGESETPVLNSLSARLRQIFPGLQIAMIKPPPLATPA